MILQKLGRFLFSTSSSPATTKLTVSECYATLTLSNAAKRNNLSLNTLTQINNHLSTLSSDPSIRALFFRSEGSVFSSGHDLKELAVSPKTKEVFQLAGDISQRFRSLPFPVVSVVNGLVAAAGLQLVASSDLVIATTKSTFSTPGVKWGVFCTTPGIALIRSFSSQKKALEMLLLGEPITAEEAYKFGLVSRVVDEANLESEVEKYKDGFNHLSQDILALGKQAFYQQKTKGDLGEAYQYGVGKMCQSLKSADGQEGLKAFQEKRHPDWKKGK